MKTTYTVTGGTGYIGSKLLEHLSQNENNYIYAIIRMGSELKIQRDNIEYVVYNRKEESLEKAIANSDYIIHLGALYTTKDDEYYVNQLIDSNITLSTLIFNVANRVNKDVVIASASTFSSLNERGGYEPATLYAATKKAVEDIAHYYKDLSIHFLTFPDTFGPGDWRPKIHNILAKNEEWPFVFKSPALQEMSMLHVEDVIGHLLSSLNNRAKGVHYHDIYAEGIYVTLKELSEIITDKECQFSTENPFVAIPKEARVFSTKTGYENKYKELKF